MEYGLGRVPSPPDERDYLMSALLADDPIPTKKIWHTDRILNQRKTPHCVGFGWAAWGIAVPLETPFRDADAHRIYAKCKVVDGEPGAQNGSTVRTGAKVMKAANRIQSYYFGTYPQALEFVGNHGTVVIGVNWYEGMNKTDSNGIIHPTGEQVGGHCILWVGIEGKYAILQNSWGVVWGVYGKCRILLSDLEDLLSERGEACAAVEKPAAPFFTRLLDAVLNIGRNNGTNR
jgi:hypothetical protein